MGSTPELLSFICFIKDHPHIHGEHLILVAAVCDLQGSPPYTWGAPIAKQTASEATRITPIYMGSTRNEVLDTWMIQDHPHIHGEHLLA